MKQSVSPRTFAVVIGVLIACVAVFAAWVWNRPSATADATSGGPAKSMEAMGNSGASERARAQADHGGPSQDQMNEIREWKKNHPGATTKY